VKLFRAVMVGPEVEWEWRDGPEYYDKRGRRRDGVEARKLRKPARATIDLLAEDENDAKRIVRQLHPEYAAYELESLDRLAR
jgi:hypothetical protein